MKPPSQAQLNSSSITISIPNADCLLVEFLDADLAQAAFQVAELNQYLRAEHSSQYLDLVPAYNSLCIFVDFPKITPQAIESIVRSFLSNKQNHALDTEYKHHQLPCYYSFESGPDLERLCREKQLSMKEFVQLHCDTTYLVYAIGFSPGFPYLAEVDERIAAPRLNTPRTEIPWGSVGIADRQTGIYPNTSPGGWNIIGRCPALLFQIPEEPREQQASNICRLNVGDTVSFNPIQREEYLHLMAQEEREK